MYKYQIIEIGENQSKKYCWGLYHIDFDLYDWASGMKLIALEDEILPSDHKFYLENYSKKLKRVFTQNQFIFMPEQLNFYSR